MKELKPCPFCGSNAKIEKDVEGECEAPIWHIVCDECPAEMRGSRNNEYLKDIEDLFRPDEKEGIIKAWNKRV